MVVVRNFSRNGDSDNDGEDGNDNYIDTTNDSDADNRSICVIVGWRSRGRILPSLV